MSKIIEDTATLIIRDIREYEPDDNPDCVVISVKSLELILLQRLEDFAAPVVERQVAAWANDQQLLLCSKSPREDQPNNPMMHNLPRNIAGSALKTDYCNTPLYTSPPAPVAVVLPERLKLTAQKDLADPVTFDWQRGWNACIDKVKELNQ